LRDAHGAPEQCTFACFAAFGNPCAVADGLHRIAGRIVATKLGIAVLLSKGALTSSEIAQSTEKRPDAVPRLLRALAAFDTVKDLDSGFAGRRVFA